MIDHPKGMLNTVELGIYEFKPGSKQHHNPIESLEDAEVVAEMGFPPGQRLYRDSLLCFTTSPNRRESLRRKEFRFLKRVFVRIV